LRWKRNDIDNWVAKLPTHDPVAPVLPPPPSPRDFGRLL
jgi:hypothetical protein